MTLLASSEWALAAAAWLVGAAGLLLAAWACFWDRARGRRRCPKCWYDMAGVPGLVCPECGRDAVGEGRLAKTRRRWVVATGAVVATLPAASLLAHLPDYRKRGWPALVPSSVLILWRAEVHKPGPAWSPMGPRTLTSQERLGNELGRRYRDDGLCRWQQRVVAHGDPKCVPDAWHLALSVRPRWPEGVPLLVRVQPAWFTGKRKRELVITPLFAGGNAVRLEITSPFVAQDIDLGVAPVGEGPVRVRVEVFEQWRSGRGTDVPEANPLAAVIAGGNAAPGAATVATLPKGKERFVRLWSQRVELPVAVGGHVEEIVRPVDDLPLDGHFAVGIGGAQGTEPRIYVGMLYVPELLGITMAVQVEFWDEREKVAGAEVLWQPDQILSGRGTLTGDIPRLRANWGSPGWRVRIVGDGHLALLDRAAARFWPGEVEIPLSEVWHMQDGTSP